MRKLMIVLAGLVPASCATEATTPPPADYRAIARDHLLQSLVDPYSVRDAQIAAPLWRSSFQLTDPGYAWTVCVKANAKNRMGGYGGMTEFVVLIRNGRGVATTEGPAPYYCDEAVYQPFPELSA